MPAVPLPDLLRHLGDLPAAFRGTPAGFKDGRVRVRAVVADLYETLLARTPGDSFLEALKAENTSHRERSRLGWVLAAAHVLWHPAFRGAALQPWPLERFLTEELAQLAAACAPSALLEDPDRREELVRRALRAAGLHPAGESAAEAEARLEQLDSVERRRLEGAALARQKRNEELRKRRALEQKLAEEAAARMSSE